MKYSAKNAKNSLSRNGATKLRRNGLQAADCWLLAVDCLLPTAYCPSATNKSLPVLKWPLPLRVWESGCC